jgi:carbon-monoxide dehydrogenase iron sulfur subunit
MGIINCRWELCLGCRQCETACAVAHSQTKTLFGAVTEKSRPYPRITLKIDKAKRNIGNKCRNCNPAPCLDYCSNGALMSDEESGNVLIDSNRCTGCGACAAGCPFGNIRLNKKEHSDYFQYVAAKCDGCFQVLTEAGVPACVQACRSGALEYTECDIQNNSDDKPPVEMSTAMDMA